MVEAWIPITCAAALFQTWRTAMQQKLRDRLSVNAAGFVRYLYALPVGLTFVCLGYTLMDRPLPPLNARFLADCAAGGLLQIIGTTLLIMAFGFRNFAVGTAYAKTEAVQGAIVAWIVLGEALTPLACLGIAVGVAGVLTLSLAGKVSSLREALRSIVQPAALCGLGTGLCFAFTAIFIKDANRALDGDLPILKALCGLLATNILQTIMQGSYLALREPDQLRASFTTWRTSGWVGTLSACGSACWFSGFALAPVALVRSLGQIEMVFTLLFSRFYLMERIRRLDLAGLALIVAGVSLILAGR